MRTVSNHRYQEAGAPKWFRLGAVPLLAGTLVAVVLLAGCGAHEVGTTGPPRVQISAVTLPGQANAPNAVAASAVNATLKTAAARTVGRVTSVKLAAPSFASSVQPIDATLKAQMVGSGSWKPGDPVSLDGLRLVHVSYWGFDGKPHTGSLVVGAAWAARLCTVFRALYNAHFPIREMNLVDVYGADDDRSMAADNTSAYNGRRVAGTSAWSMHSYGLAIDLNPVENPYIHGATVSPVEGEAYVDRSHLPLGAIKSGDVAVRAFAAIGTTRRTTSISAVTGGRICG